MITFVFVSLVFSIPLYTQYYLNIYSILKYSIVMLIAILILDYSAYNIYPIFLYFNFYITPIVYIYKYFIYIIFFIILATIPYYYAQFISIEFIILSWILIFSIVSVITTYDIFYIYFYIEIQSFVIYVFTSIFNRNYYTIFSTIYYAIIGSFASILMIISVSILYSIYGTFNIIYLYNIYHIHSYTYIIFNIFIFGLLIKIGSFPFHTWINQIYSILPIFTFNIVLNLPKLSILFIVFNINYFIPNYIFYFFIIGSIFIGAFYPIGNTNFKYIFTYSSINQIGFILIPTIASTYTSITIFIFYIIVYIISNVTIMATIINNFFRFDIQYIYNFNYITFNNFTNVFIIIVQFFNISATPPFIAFVTKYIAILSLVYHHLFFIALIAIFSSVITSYYYFNIIKYTIFNINYYFIPTFDATYNCTNIYSAIISTISYVYIFSFAIYTYWIYYIYIIVFELYA